MIAITINGSAREFGAGTTLAELIVDLTGSTRGSAAVVDDEIVPRSCWADTVISDGACVEIITAVQGG